VQEATSLLSGFGVSQNIFFLAAAGGKEEERNKWGHPTPRKGAGRPFDPRFDDF